MIVRSKSHPAVRQQGKHGTIGPGTPRAPLPQFLVESTSVGYDDGIRACLSLVLILEVKILGRGARPVGLAKP